MSEEIRKLLLENLDEEDLRLLFPGRFTERTRVSLMYAPLEGEDAERARELTAQAAEFDITTAERDVHDEPRHRATFTLDQMEPLFQLFHLIAEDPARESDVQIDGHRLPMTMELWLPLLWAMRF
ncbi:MAG TPA: hypothetical protein QGG47_04595 [Acidobacteriota bacterium]|nr:hypothetical protein [Acidobacteriota bacterium]